MLKSRCKVISGKVVSRNDVTPPSKYVDPCGSDEYDSPMRMHAEFSGSFGDWAFLSSNPNVELFKGQTCVQVTLAVGDAAEIQKQKKDVRSGL